MNQKSLATLEYKKIIDQLSEYAASMPGKALCLSLQPSSDYCEILQAQAETTDAASRVRMKGNLSLAGVRDVWRSAAPLVSQSFCQ